MNKTLLIGGIVALLVIVVVVGYLFFSPSKPLLSPGSVTFPGGGATPIGSGGAGGTGKFKTILTYDKKELSVHDFTQDAGVVADPNIPGQYDIAGGVTPTSSTPYQIFYQTTDDYFGITLYHEPLSASRAAAENELLRILGVSKEALCTLSYVVAVGPGVNDAYAGKNLGFSFCPGATKLP
jgi:hypothetical protein